MKTSQLFVATSKNDESTVTTEPCKKCNGTGLVPVTGCCRVCRGRKTRIVVVKTGREDAEKP